MRARPALLLALVAAGCVAPAPRVVSRPEPATPPPIIAAPPPLAGDWRDWPVTAGTWNYARDAGGTVASFGQAGAPALATLRCDREGGRVLLSIAGASGGAVTVRTSSIARTLPLGGSPVRSAATLAPADPLLDAMAFSRGRFAVQQTGVPPLVLPAWAEVGRVVEDCRP